MQALKQVSYIDGTSISFFFFPGPNTSGNVPPQMARTAELPTFPPLLQQKQLLATLYSSIQVTDTARGGVVGEMETARIEFFQR